MGKRQPICSPLFFATIGNVYRAKPDGSGIEQLFSLANMQGPLDTPLANIASIAVDPFDETVFVVAAHAGRHRDAVFRVQQQVRRVAARKRAEDVVVEHQQTGHRFVDVPQVHAHVRRRDLLPEGC